MRNFNVFYADDKKRKKLRNLRSILSEIKGLSLHIRLSLFCLVWLFFNFFFIIVNLWETRGALITFFSLHLQLPLKADERDVYEFFSRAGKVIFLGISLVLAVAFIMSIDFP